MSNERDFDVFLSYSGEGRPWAREFANALRSEGIRAWHDEEEITFGDKWVEKMESALRHSPAVVFIITPASLDSPWTFFEIGAAIAGEKRIIPIIIDDIAPEALPRSLRQYQFLRETAPSRAAELIAGVLKSAPTDAAA
jgi:nucleoside 2-deoxyribosyltransferase